MGIMPSKTQTCCGRAQSSSEAAKTVEAWRLLCSVAVLEACFLFAGLVSAQAISRIEPLAKWHKMYDGFWYRKEDGRFMGEIAQRQLLVNRRSVLPLEEVEPGLLLLCDGDDCIAGRVSLDAQAMITWGSKEVWLRK
ncbi:unnamed protein product [Effrenium voratum]|nr:unnamed protein product [Effrenium voratum]